MVPDNYGTKNNLIFCILKSIYIIFLETKLNNQSHLIILFLIFMK